MRRLILFVIFIFSIVLLWNNWLKQNNTEIIYADTSLNIKPEAHNTSSINIVPDNSYKENKNPTLDFKLSSGESVVVTTDIFRAELNTQGGNIQRLDLIKHKDTDNKSKPFTLMQDNKKFIYLAQSGLLGAGLPTHNEKYSVAATEYKLEENSNSIKVRFIAPSTPVARVSKVYTFYKSSSLVDVAFEIENISNSALETSAYYQLVRDSSVAVGESSFVPTFTGGALYTEQEKFRKIDFSTIDKDKVNLPANSDNGWIGILQHYFVSAWIPEGGVKREFFAKKINEQLYSIGLVLPVSLIEPGKIGIVSTTLYAGPAQAKLDSVAPGLGLTVDYGWLTIFSTPLFWLLDQINKIVNNWGVAIILLTILIKLLFFPLSAASYRSMAKMRILAPKLEKIKQQYGDDRDKLNRAMMDLYKSENINPLGGCLPILIQIPVFIALYWAILSSVELRNAPFIGWITDLSATDPLYILPFIMGVSMFVQSKLNPVPPDPLQARLMQVMPIVFSVVFFWFPAGLVLYSIVNNLLSIAQQWYITRGTETEQKSSIRG